MILKNLLCAWKRRYQKSSNDEWGEKGEEARLLKASHKLAVQIDNDVPQQERGDNSKYDGEGGKKEKVKVSYSPTLHLL